MSLKLCAYSELVYTRDSVAVLDCRSIV